MALGAFFDVVASNVATSPTTVSTLAGFSAGTVLAPNTVYELLVYCYFSGTAPVDGTDSDNIRISVNGNPVSPALLVPAVAGVAPQPIRVIVMTDSTGTVVLRTVNNATTGTIYHTMIVAHPLAGNPGSWGFPSDSYL